MTRSTTACLLLLLCLLSHRATSQVYQLRAGDVVRGPLIGIDTATYRSTRQYVAAAGQLLDVRAQRIATLERSNLLADSTTATALAELRRCRAGAAATEADYERMRQAARVALASPPRPPLLFDSHFYQGTAVGVVAALLLKVFVFH
jgi:hypothetical protein